MKRIRITVIRKACYRDLMERYENPLEHPCDLSEGQSFECDGLSRPEGLCESAWQSLSPFVMALAHGATGLYDGWMKNPASAMLSCNDGFRPVSFLVEALDDPAPDGQASGSGEPAARKGPADPTPGSGEPARKGPAAPTPGREMPARKEPDRPDTRPGNRPETRPGDASPAAAPATASAAAPANPETRPYEKTES